MGDASVSHTRVVALVKLTGLTLAVKLVLRGVSKGNDEKKKKIFLDIKVVSQGLAYLDMDIYYAY